MTDLLPCPFCGGKAIESMYVDFQHDGGILEIKMAGCEQCDIRLEEDKWQERVGTLVDDIPEDPAEDNYQYICNMCTHYSDCVSCTTCRVTGFDPK